MYADPTGSREGPGTVPAACIFKGRRPIPRLPELAHAAARGLSLLAALRDASAQTRAPRRRPRSSERNASTLFREKEYADEPELYLIAPVDP